jgi:hypothetical protein
MAIVLPKQKLKPTRTTPKRLLLYGAPKCGKTEILTQLESNLILDMEDGATMYECNRVAIKTYQDIFGLCAEILKEGKANGGKYPFRYISIDTGSKLEDIAERLATDNYKQSIIGSTFKGTSCLELPQGMGYYLIRVAYGDLLDMLEKVCEKLIIVCHVKDKLISEMEGSTVSTKAVSLTGKLSDIVCAHVDAIGYLYRKNSELWVSFNSMGDMSAGCRFKHLAGSKIPFDWEAILLTGKYADHDYQQTVVNGPIAKAAETV